MNLKYYYRKAADVRFHDIFSFFPMLAGLVASIFVHKWYANTWAISERKDEARDNGYHFFRFLRTEHPEQDCIYVIDPDCCDSLKVRILGKVVPYGSFKHWILYFSCPYLVSSQSFKPNNYMATLFERMGVFRPNHVFLQHGITKDMADFLLASHRKVKYFIAGAKPEYEFIRDRFGYPEGTIHYTGFARFDALHDYTVTRNRILIMPTWRKWLIQKSEEHEDARMDLVSSEYIIQWAKLLKSIELEDLIKKYNLEVLFYPHPNMKNLLDPNLLVGPFIKVADHLTDDLQELMKSSQMLITDYSSVFFDMCYMKKPVIFYQFDEAKYRKYHYKEGWFHYHETSLGTWCGNTKSVLETLEATIKQNYAITEDYINEHSSIFTLYDGKNCERIYKMLKDGETDMEHKQA